MSYIHNAYEHFCCTFLLLAAWRKLLPILAHKHNVVEECELEPISKLVLYSLCTAGRHQSHPAEGIFSEQYLWKVLQAVFTAAHR